MSSYRSHRSNFQTLPLLSPTGALAILYPLHYSPSVASGVYELLLTTEIYDDNASLVQFQSAITFDHARAHIF
jgi:hypothetical protein